MKKYKFKYTDPETEPDYCKTLTCIECGEKQPVSGQESDFHEIDDTNFVCEYCRGYDPAE